MAKLVKISADEDESTLVVSPVNFSFNQLRGINVYVKSINGGVF